MLLGVRTLLSGQLLPHSAESPLSKLLNWDTKHANPNLGSILTDDKSGFPLSIYVVSLPRRQDRRVWMEVLRGALGLKWTYVDAVDLKHPVVRVVLEHLRAQRTEIEKAYDETSLVSQENTTDMARFWPENLDTVFDSNASLPVSGSNLWFSSSLDVKDASIEPEPEASSTVPLTCAEENSIIPSYSPGLPEYRLLSAAKIACWHSHLSAIRRIANVVEDHAALILEDDVDIEWDFRKIVMRLWDLLPSDWDIVFLGHCWSNESTYPALQNSRFSFHNRPQVHQWQLHPSFAPKCTHAYVLSHTGARRLLLHLTHPPFAYSRAIDQALSWLVYSGRMKSFSVVPSLVVQRKDGESDVASGVGSEWRDSLVHGVLGS